MTYSRVSVAAALALGLATAACEEGELMRPAVPAYTGAEMFQRYVSMGNSITAGFQSGGISEPLQRAAYPVLVARQMGGQPFQVPALLFPGCPPPYANVFTQTRIATIPGDCAFRAPGEGLAYVSNVAVPGAEALDATTNGPAPGTNSNALTMLLLGGRTQADAMADARPTFVSLWIGNNDVLGAATDNTNAGDSTLITLLTTFQANYTAVLDDVQAAGADALLIGVANVTAIPFFSAGATYWAIDNGLVPGSSFPPTFTVENNCAPIATGIPGARGDSTLVPFPYGGLLLATAQAGGPATLSCADTVPRVVVPAELRALTAAVAAYNAFISTQASSRAWAYWDPNTALDSLRGVPGQVASFPAFGAACSANPFGLALSCDGVHPSSAVHTVIARHVISEINTHYGTAIPQIP